MNVDSHYVIGHSHLNNEDYAISGMEPVPYMILADGCSSSDFSDIGARMLVMSAKEYLMNHIASGLVPDARDLGLYAALKAEAAVTVAGTPLSAIDATLIVAFVKDDQVYVYLYGDGALFYTDREADFHLTQVDYSHNAPYYPSYQVDKPRDREYRALSVLAQKWVTTDGAQTTVDLYTPTVRVLPLARLRTLVVTSDGLASFVNTQNAESIPADTVARALVTFKNTTGDFVKRRIKRSLKTMAKDGIYNSDDISIAAMVFYGT